MKKLVKRRTIIWFISICVLSFCNIFNVSAQSTTDQDEDMEVDSACGGTERWAQKVLTDALVSTVNCTPIISNVASLVALNTPVPNPNMLRQVGLEDKTYQITCTIKEKKAETDDDYHLVLSDGTHTLIGEIPNPVCSTAVTSAHLIQYTNARNFIDAHIASGNVYNVNIGTVIVTGVPFVDPPHGQTGAAPNNLELHPILDIHFASSTAPPTAYFMPSASPACTGQSVVLTDNSSNSPTSWNWTTPGATTSSSTAQSPTVTYTTAGTYTVTLVCTNSFGSSAPVSHSIVVNVSPPVPTVTVSGSTFTSSASTGNQWYYNGLLISGITSQTYNGTASGTYTTVVTNSFGCSETSNPINFTATGIAQMYDDNYELTIYPNPFSSQTTVTFNKEQKNTRIKVIDVLGKEIKTINFTGKQLILEKGEMQEGIYLLQVQTEYGAIVKKIVIGQ